MKLKWGLDRQRGSTPELGTGPKLGEVALASLWSRRQWMRLYSKINM